MHQFTVPQFIDVEDKIFGPITVRQFVILLSGVILTAICYKIFDFSLFVTIAILNVVFCGTFAFARVNGRPFHLFVLNIIQTLKKTRLRVWSNALENKVVAIEIEQRVVRDIQAPIVKKYTASRLAELSLVIDTGGAYKGDESRIMN